MQVPHTHTQSTAADRHAPMVDQAEVGMLLSALADGELSERECAQLMRHLDAQGTSGAPFARWESYQVIGECLRAPEQCHAAVESAAFLQKFRDRLGDEPATYQPATGQAGLQPAPQLAPVEAGRRGEAANASVFRWKMVAGFASLAAVAAIGWNSVATFSGAPGQDMQLASGGSSATAAAPAQANGSIVTVAGNEPQASGPLRQSESVLIRDPKLDELLQRQYGNTLALQPPAAFLRNASASSQ